MRLGLRTGDLLELERRAGHHVEHRLVARDAALADRIPEQRGARRGLRDLVVDLERRGVGREQLVARVLVLRGLLGARWRRRGLLSAGRAGRRGLLPALRARRRDERERGRNLPCDSRSEPSLSGHDYLAFL